MLPIAPCSSPCSFGSTCRVMICCPAADASPQNMRIGVLSAKTIPFGAKPYSASPVAPAAIPAYIARRSPSRFTSGPVAGA